MAFHSHAPRSDIAIVHPPGASLESVSTPGSDLPPKPAKVFTRGVILVACANACFFLAHSSMLPVFPLYVKARGGSDFDIAFMVGLMGIVSIVTRPFTGWAIDAWGRKSMLAVGLGSLAACGVGFGYAVALPVLGLIRSLQSTAVGVVNSAANTYVSDTAPPGRRAEAIGYVVSIQTVFTTIGPSIGYLVVTWSALYAFNQYAVWWPDLGQGPGSEYAFAALFAGITVLSLIGTWFATLVPEAKRPPVTRKISIRSLVDRRAALPLLLSTLITVSFAGILSFLPFYAPERGLDNVGLYFTVQSLGILSAGLTTGRLADRMGRRPVIIGTMLIAAISMFVLGTAANGLIVLVSGYLSGIGQGGARNTISALTADSFPPNERGSALSTVSMGFDLGVSFGAPLLGLVVAAYGFAACFLVAGAVSLAGTAIAIFWLTERPRMAN